MDPGVSEADDVRPTIARQVGEEARVSFDPPGSSLVTEAVDDPPWCGERADSCPRSIQCCLHPRYLTGREHEHAGIVRVVHIVHEHVAVRTVVAGSIREGGTTEVLIRLIGGVVDQVSSVTPRSIVSPDVAKV